MSSRVMSRSAIPSDSRTLASSAASGIETTWLDADAAAANWRLIASHTHATPRPLIIIPRPKCLTVKTTQSYSPPSDEVALEQFHTRDSVYVCIVHSLGRRVLHGIGLADAHQIHRMTGTILPIPAAHRLRTAAKLLAALALTACSGDQVTVIQSLTVSIQPRRALIVGVGQSLDFDAVARDARGALVSGEVQWSSDAAIAEILSNGLATGVAAGVTTISATIEGFTGTAQLEVFVPEQVGTYEVGTSYFGRREYVEYIPGDLPVVMSAPHGGAFTPNEIADRTFGVTGTDRNTVELILAVREAFLKQTGRAPHVIISHLARVKLDPNREIVEAAQDDPYAEQAWQEFQGWIKAARVTIDVDFGRGMYFDLHGHGHDIDRLELGYLLSAADLNRSDVALNAVAFVASSSIRDLGRDSPLPFSQLLRGPTSLGGYLQAEGVRGVPSPGDVSPGSDAYFTGGYNTREHGARSDGEVISGVQIEHHFSGLRDTSGNRRVYAAQLARSIRAFMLEHYGFFSP